MASNAYALKPRISRCRKRSHAALILHPSRRLTYIKKNWKKEWQKPAFAGVKKLWEFYREQALMQNRSRPINVTLQRYG